MSQKEKTEALKKLHHTGKLLIFPNIWDPMGALLLEDMGYQAIATASASVALSNGYKDGEQIPFDDLAGILKRIAAMVSVPVSADVESGFAADTATLKENIKTLISAGVAGINLEDTEKATGLMYSIERQVERLEAVKEAAAEMGTDLFLNARTDVYLPGSFEGTPESRFEEALRRGEAYKKAGADCFFPVLLRDRDEISGVVNTLQMPVNIISFPGIPDLDELETMGVARLSLGPSFYRAAIRSMRDLASQLCHKEGLSEIISNDLTTAYLSRLIPI